MPSGNSGAAKMGTYYKILSVHGQMEKREDLDWEVIKVEWQMSLQLNEKSENCSHCYATDVLVTGGWILENCREGGI